VLFAPPRFNRTDEKKTHRLAPRLGPSLSSESESESLPLPEDESLPLPEDELLELLELPSSSLPSAVVAPSARSSSSSSLLAAAQKREACACRGCGGGGWRRQQGRAVNGGGGARARAQWNRRPLLLLLLASFLRNAPSLRTGGLTARARAVSRPESAGARAGRGGMLLREDAARRDGVCFFVMIVGAIAFDRFDRDREGAARRSCLRTRVCVCL